MLSGAFKFLQHPGDGEAGVEDERLGGEVSEANRNARGEIRIDGFHRDHSDNIVAFA